MEKNDANTATAEAFMNQWMDAAKGLWNTMAGLGADAPRTFGASGKSQQEKIQKNWETGSRMLQSMMTYMGKPETLEGLFKGVDAAPDLAADLARQSWEGYFDLQKQWMERAAKMGRQTQAYSFEDIDQDTFKSIRELYEKEFRKFLQVPQLGLNRFHHEKLNRLLDSQALFQATLGEFLYVFYVPVEKTAGVMQEKLEAMAEAGEIHDDARVYYSMWVKILEGHYMTLLKSSEYTEVMDSTLAALLDYKAAREDFLCDVLQNLPIPTHRDMDALYKDFHMLKKQFRELKRKLERQESAVEENA